MLFLLVIYRLSLFVLCIDEALSIWFWNETSFTGFGLMMFLLVKDGYVYCFGMMLCLFFFGLMPCSLFLD